MNLKSWRQSGLLWKLNVLNWGRKILLLHLNFSDKRRSFLGKHTIVCLGGTTAAEEFCCCWFFLPKEVLNVNYTQQAVDMCLKARLWPAFCVSTLCREVIMVCTSMIALSWYLRIKTNVLSFQEWKVPVCVNLKCIRNQLDLFFSSQKQSLALTSDISVLEMSRKELENQMGSLREKHQRDAASLKTQLSEAESQAKDFQKEVTWNVSILQ